LTPSWKASKVSDLPIEASTEPKTAEGAQVSSQAQEEAIRLFKIGRCTIRITTDPFLASSRQLGTAGRSYAVARAWTGMEPLKQANRTNLHEAHETHRNGT
jgi:hypothetical protein